MPSHNLFVVASPFQLICAQEAREELCEGAENHLVIIDRAQPGEPDYDQKGQELDDGWDVVSRHSEPRRRGLRRLPVRFFITAAIIRKHGCFRGRVFLSTPYVKWFNFIAWVYGTGTTLIDDGAASVYILKRLEALGKLDGSQKGSLNFYTLFAGQDHVRRSQGAIIHNTLRHLSRKRRKDQKIEKSRALFMGQPLSEAKVADEDAEILKLQNLVERFPEYSFTYATHRYEGKAKLDRISPLMEIVHSTQSIETVLLEQEILPTAVFSWYSTALFTLKHMFPELSYFALRAPETLAHQKRVGEIGNIYEALDEVGVQVLE